MRTRLTIDGNKFYINDKLTYSEYDKGEVQGLLMNARFVQGIYDDSNGLDRYQRFGRVFIPGMNTEQLIRELPSWYRYGLRAFTVGLQGGGPRYTMDNKTIHNNPYIYQSTSIDLHYAQRLSRLIEAADQLGMVVIVSLFYSGQVYHFNDDEEIRNSVIAACNFIRENGYTNIIVEICNGYDLIDPECILGQVEGIASLISLGKSILPDTPFSCSCSGGHLSQVIAKASDVIFIHGNDQTRQTYYELIKRARDISDGKPIMCNEDSACLGHMAISIREYVSWGYHNMMTKQEVPVDWSITKGEDTYFANRMAMALGIINTPEVEEYVYLQGLEYKQSVDGKRWIRLAALYPEKIDHVDFYYYGQLFQRAYEEPYMINFVSNWFQDPVEYMNEEGFSVDITYR